MVIPLFFDLSFCDLFFSLTRDRFRVQAGPAAGRLPVWYERFP